jgi:LmbE family N-acetylglucosaminyl deacetylase
MGRTVLVIAAHPDDEVVGVGGTIVRHAEAGDEVHVLFVTDGQRGREDPERGNDRKQNALACGQVLGVSDIHFSDLPDTRLDRVAHREINSVLEDRIDALEPEIVYTHAAEELHRDHSAVHESTLVATRPGSGVQSVLAYEVPSSTNRTTAGDFQPTAYVDVSNAIETKIEALSEYTMETGTAPHPRSADVVRGVAAYRGTAAGYTAAEAFQTVVAYYDSTEEIH